MGPRGKREGNKAGSIHFKERRRAILILRQRKRKGRALLLSKVGGFRTRGRPHQGSWTEKRGRGLCSDQGVKDTAAFSNISAKG